MAGKKSGSDGQIRKTTAEWAADTKTYLEGMRLMDTDTGVVRVSKGTTYALAWLPDSSGGVSQAYVDAADENLQSQIDGIGPTAFADITGNPSDNVALESRLETLANGIGAIVTQTITEDALNTSPSEDAVFDALAAQTAATNAKVADNMTSSATVAPSKDAVIAALAGRARIAIVSGGALVVQSNAVLVPFSGVTISDDGAGKCVIFLTSDGLTGGTDLFGSLIGMPTITVTGTGADETSRFSCQIIQVTLNRKVEVFVTDGLGAPAADGTAVDIWVCGVPA